MSRMHPLLAVTTLVLGLVLGACYEPDILDCTVTCTEPTDCAGDQVCGIDGFCAAASVAGTCGGEPAANVMLSVKVDGVGRIRVHEVGDCDRDDVNRGECSWLVPPAPVQVEAIEIDDESKFERWTTTTCTDEPASCTFTPTAATLVSARFR